MELLNEDDVFQIINTYNVGTKAYGINPHYYSSININVFYSYNHLKKIQIDKTI